MKPTPEQIKVRQCWAIDNLSAMRDRLRALLEKTRIEKEFSEHPEREQYTIARIEAQLQLLDLLFSGDYE